MTSTSENHAIPDGLDLFDDQNPRERVSDNPSDLVMVLMAKSGSPRDAQSKAKN